MDDLDLKEVGKIIKKRKKFLLTFVLLVTFITAIYSFSATPIYQAKARVLVKEEKPTPVKFENNLKENIESDEFVETQIELIGSRSLIRNVIEELNLEENPEFNTPPSFFSFPDLFSETDSSSENGDSDLKLTKLDPYTPLVDLFQKRLNVYQVKNSRVLEITFEGKSPVLITEITNRLAKKYVERSLTLTSSWENSSVVWLDNKLKELNIKLKNSERKIQLFKQKRNFVEKRTGEDLASSKWNETHQELAKATSERRLLESQMKELKVIKNDPLQLVMAQPFSDSPALIQLQKQYIEMTDELNTLLKSKTENHPDVVLLTQKLNSLKQKIPSEVQFFLSSLEMQLKAVINREKILEKALEKQQKEMMKADDDSVQFKFLMAEVELNKNLYNEVLNRKKELEVLSNFQESNINVVDFAEVPYKPVKPKKALNMILAVLFGSFGGFLIIFFQETSYKTINMDEDIDQEPYFLWGSVANAAKEHQNNPIAAPLDFQGLKTQFLLKNENTPNKIFLVTSPKPLEGKSYITTNLAISLGRSGKRVLIIDADPYNSKIAEILDSPTNPGYLNDLSGKNKIAHLTKHKFVWQVPPGEENNRIETSSEIFLSSEFQQFIKDAESNWDFILIKASPVLATPDAKVLLNYCHGLLLVLQSGAHDPKMVRNIFKQLTANKSTPAPDFLIGRENGDSEGSSLPNGHKLLGIVINQVDRKYKNIEYSYYQNHYKQLRA